MLTLTADAVSAIRQITVRTGRSAGSGIRIWTSITEGNGVPALKIDIAEEPAPSDEIVEAEGARVFLDPDASTALSDKQLDATVREGRARFLIAGSQG